MQSNFKYTLDTLKRINGQGSDDKSIAKAASTEMLDFVQKKAKVLDDYLNLVSVMDGDSFNELNSVILSMKHIKNAFEELAAFHYNDPLIDEFDIARHKADEIFNSSNKKLSNLRSKIES